MASYAAVLMTSLTSKLGKLIMEQIAVSTVLAHIAKFEHRIQRLAFTTNITTRNQLTRELKAMPSLKTKLQSSNNEPEELCVKQLRITYGNFKFYNFGKFGHKAAVCRLNFKTNDLQNATINKPLCENSITKKPTNIVSFRCREIGHYASRCQTILKGKESGSKSGVCSGRRVNVCVLNTPSGNLLQSGEQYSFYCDSGAECSLMKESISSKFKGKRFHNLVTMTGIGQASINSTLQILTIVEINYIKL